MAYVPASAPEITAWLEAHPPRERQACAASIVDRLDAASQRDPTRFSTAACEALLRGIGHESNEARAWLDAREQSPTVLYLKARLLAAARSYDEAMPLWAQLLATVPSPDPELLLQHGRLLAELQDFDGAATRVREALACRPGYAFHARAAAFIERLRARQTHTARQVRIAVLGSSTTQLLVPVLRAFCFRDRIQADFYEGPYGAFRQEILDPGSGLYAFEPTIILIVNHWRDLQLPAVSSDEGSLVNRVVGDYRQLWETAAARTRSHIVQQGFDLPGSESDTSLAMRPAGRTRIIHSINQALSEAAPPFVSIIDTISIQIETGHAAWADPALWCTAKQHPATAALPSLAEAYLASIRAVAGLGRKVVVCDLDNTLWGGIIGEDGIDGIRIGPGTPQGEAYAALQEYLLELQQRGVLLAVCSKNNLEDARLPFERHPGMRLRLEHFAAFVANWRDKVENVRSIASALSLGTDSFVFLDDNPFERAWIRSQLPDVEVVELGRSPYTFVRELDRLRLFQSVALTDEDRRRTALYRESAEREAAREAAGSLEDFLQQLQMRATDAPVTASNLARVTQLINKTNQFNLTTRRLTEGAVADLASDPTGWARAFHLSDRFGDHGLIGVLVCVTPAPDTWEIHTWLMSCRVLGRRMEQFMFERVREAALARNVHRIVGVYRPTAKNGQVADLYRQLGFTPVEPTAEEQRFELVIAASPADPAPTFIEHVPA